MCMYVYEQMLVLIWVSQYLDIGSGVICTIVYKKLKTEKFCESILYKQKTHNIKKKQLKK